MNWRGSDATSQRRVITAQDAVRLRNLLDTRIAALFPREARALAGELERAAIVSARNVPPDVVTMNSRFVYVRPDGRRIEATLVYPWDVAHSLGAINVLSEQGVAMLGSRIGSPLRPRNAPGESSAILRILYQPEHAGDLHL